MKKNVIGLMIVCLLFGTILAACSNNGSNSSSSTSGANNGASTGQSGGNAASGGDAKDATPEPVKIQMWERLSGRTAEKMNELVEEFNQEYPHITVEINEVANAEYPAALQAGIAGGNLPDMFMNTPSVPLLQMVELGLLRNLDDLVTPELKAKFTPATWTEGQATINGSIYAIPHSDDRRASIILYNKELLKKAGYDQVPKRPTWEQFIEMNKKVIEASPGISGFVFAGPAPWISDEGILQIASAITPEAAPISELQMFNFKTGQYDLNNEGLVQTLHFFKRMQDEGLLHPNSLLFNPSEARAQFWEDQAAFVWESTPHLQVFQMNDKYGVIQVPTRDGNASYRAFQGFLPNAIVVNEKTQHYEEVKLFLNYFLNHYGAKMAELYVSGLPYVEAIQPSEPWYLYDDTVAITKTDVIDVPNPAIRNPNTIVALNEMSRYKPTVDFSDVFLGYMAGEVTDLQGLLDRLTEDLNKALASGIADSNKNGSPVTPEDFIYEDWVPGVPYVN